MGFSLEVRKFINSEHTGDYVEIVLPGTPEPASKKKQASAPEESVETVPEVPGESLKLHYMEAGDGEPLILVHTVAQSLYTWRTVFDRLSEHYRVIALDMPGHGYSGRPVDFGYTIDEGAYVLGAFMDVLGITSAHFMAFSMGCAPVLKLSLTSPERVGRVILLSPGGVTPEMPLSVKMIDSPLFGFVASYLYSMRTIETLLKDAVFDLTNITPEVVQEYYRPISDSGSRSAVRRSLQYYDDEAVVGALRELKVPALILQGSEDKWHHPESCAELYHAAMKDASFAVIRNAGHLLHEEKPERIVEATLEYIPVVMP